MIVEDEAVILMQLETLLEDAGHIIVATAMSGREAVQKIEATRPELVLLDVQLRDGSSGIEVAQAVRDIENLTLVFLTANALKLDENMNGAAAVLRKPFSDRTLESTIAYMEECVHRPPPLLALPAGLRLAPAYIARLNGFQTMLQ